MNLGENEQHQAASSSAETEMQFSRIGEHTRTSVTSQSIAFPRKTLCVLNCLWLESRADCSSVAVSLHGTLSRASA